MFDVFYSKISEIVNLHIPVKELSKREVKIKSEPWITFGIRVSIQVKNKLFKKFLRTKSPYYHAKFKHYRNILNHILRISRKQYYNEYFSININDSKRVWNKIKQKVCLKSKSKQILTKIVKDNHEIIDMKNIPNTFNKYFANVGDQLANTIHN